MKKIKKFFLPGAGIVFSSYVSFFFLLGAFFGYLLVSIFDRRFLKTGKIEPLIIDIGAWKLHIHHWISGILAIPVILSFFSSVPIFLIGVCGGLAFHDIYTDKKWYKIIYKNNIYRK